MPTREAHAAAAGLFREAGNGNGAVVIGVESALWCGLHMHLGIRFHVPTRRRLQLRCGRRSRCFFPSESCSWLQRPPRLPAKNTKMVGDFSV